MEVAMAVAAIAVLLWGTLKIWSWVDTTLVRRQQQFQQTRLMAGQAGTMGVINPYAWEPLNIYSNRSLPPPRTDIALDKCPAGQKLIDDANKLLQQVAALRQQADVFLQQAKPFEQEIERIAAIVLDPNQDTKLDDGCEWALENGDYDRIGFRCNVLSGASWKPPLREDWQQDCGNTTDGEELCTAAGNNLQDLRVHEQPLLDAAKPLADAADQLSEQAEALIAQARKACGFSDVD